MTMRAPLPSPSSSPIAIVSCRPPPSLVLPPLSLTKASSPNKTLTLGRSKLSVRCRRSEYFEPHQRIPSAPAEGSAVAPQTQSSSSSRVFVGHSIYKGKAALTVEPRAPEFAPLDSGAYKLSKEGFVLLQFAPAVATRQYDWTRKQVFSLSVGEIGTLMSLGLKESCEFFHDPFKGRSEEGKVRKVLKAEPLPDGTGHFFNLSVQNRVLNVDESIYIPITRAEFTILNSAFNFIVPYLLGWHAFTSTIRPEDSVRSNNTNSRSGPELEWSR